jgi:Flp pilus assembly protein TadG
MSGLAKPRSLRAIWRDRGGAAAVEFAFVFPVFLALVVSIFEFGWAQHKLSSIRWAMEAASRDLQLTPTLTEAQMSTKVKAKLSGIADQNVTITMTTGTVSGAKVAYLKGVYTTNIGVPYLATVPVNWQTTVTTPLYI